MESEFREEQFPRSRLSNLCPSSWLRRARHYVFAIFAAFPSPGEPAKEPSNLELRGRNLRKDIVGAYRGAKRSPMPRKGLDVTHLVTKYIPVGSSFEDAEAILRSAGCRVVRLFPGDNHTGELRYEDAVSGVFALKRRFPSVTEFLAFLTPRAPGDYSVIDKVEAVIAVTFI